MNWERAKTILIILFSVMNILLLSLYIYFNYDANRINANSIDQTVQILSSHGIAIDRDTIDQMKHKDYELHMKNITKDKDKTAKRFLGNHFKTDNHATYFSGEKTLLFENNRFAYRERRNWERVNDKEVSDKTLSLCQKHLSQLGFDKKSYFMYNVKIEDGMITFSILPRFRNYKVEGVSLKALADKKGVLSMEGSWYDVEHYNTNSKGTFCDITSVLLEFMYSSSNHQTITKTEICYRITPELAEKQLIAPQPVYVITTSDQKTYIFDAKNSLPIQKDEQHIPTGVQP